MKNKIKGIECPGAIGQPGKKGKIAEMSLSVCDICNKEIGFYEVQYFNVNNGKSYHLACSDMEILKRKKLKDLEIASRIIRGK